MRYLLIEPTMRNAGALVNSNSNVGSRGPTGPTFPRALTRFADNLDARAEMYLEFTKNVSPGGWSHHENPLHRALYVPE